MRQCPECDAENADDVETCVKCNFGITQFLGFSRFMNAWEKAKEEKAKAEAKKKAESAPAKKSFFDFSNLGGSK